ncbi:phage protease [Sporomusa sp. KB1]|uniref:phage protease n=1 Tax=Sporomusa sp. KB1 TaxID=943346 RepID=UPI0011ADE33A|nr:phage protease [Sporomusa sp. KB1]TWH45903.1 Mu-like prophage I protein [Sporomusa sp. KB1]
MLKIPFLRLGEWVHPVYEKIKITQQTFDDILRNFKDNVLGKEPFIRLGHDKGGKPTFGDAPAEGWVKQIVQEGNVLCAIVEPTSETAAENIRSKRFRFSSAEFTPNGIDKETGNPVGALLSAIALTNEPFLTKLPEATLLANLPDLFYLDFSEPEENDKGARKVEEMVKQFIEMLKNFITGQKAENEGMKKQQEETQKQLADMNKLLTDQLTLAQQQTQIAEQARLLAEVDKQATELVSLGIPPVMVDNWKTLASSDAGQVVLKLADDAGTVKDISQAEAMRQMLLALPEAHRIPMGQRGTQSTGDDADKIKLACDADIIALGGTITADGKYKI